MAKILLVDDDVDLVNMNRVVLERRGHQVAAAYSAQEAREAIRNLNRAAQGAAEGTERVRGTLAKLEEAGDNIRATTGVVRSLFGSRFIPAASLLVGVRAGVKVLWKLYTRRREAS